MNHVSKTFLKNSKSRIDNKMFLLSCSLYYLYISIDIFKKKKLIQVLARILKCLNNLTQSS